VKRRMIHIVILLVIAASANLAIAAACSCLGKTDRLPQGYAPDPLSNADRAWLQSARSRAISADYTVGICGVSRGVGLEVREIMGAHEGTIPGVYVYEPLAILTRAGWPLKCLQGGRVCRLAPCLEPETSVGALTVDFYSGAVRGYVYRDLPLTPIWLPLAINTFLYLIALVAIFGMVRFVRRAIRCGRRQCLSCGYPIGSSGVCPECGSATVGPVAAQHRLVLPPERACTTPRGRADRLGTVNHFCEIGMDACRRKPGWSSNRQSVRRILRNLRTMSRLCHSWRSRSTDRHPRR
jgi:hypothetical protein